MNIFYLSSTLRCCSANPTSKSCTCRNSVCTVQPRLMRNHLFFLPCPLLFVLHFGVSQEAFPPLPRQRNWWMGQHRVEIRDCEVRRLHQGFEFRGGQQREKDSHVLPHILPQHQALQISRYLFDAVVGHRLVVQYAARAQRRCRKCEIRLARVGRAMSPGSCEHRDIH